MRFSILLTLLLGLGVQAQAASTLRCASAIVSLQDTTATVARKCGEPASRSVVGTRKTPGPGVGYSEVPVEEWVYGPENGMYQYLRFVGARLDSIDSQRN